MSEYGQFCPIAKAMEILDQRWTMLVMREVVSGSSRFNEIRRGVPKMSPALLSTRLRQLQRAGLVERVSGRGHIEYLPTPAGRELREVLEMVGRWGTRWIGELGDVDLDPHLLMWDMRRRIDLAALPAARTVLAFDFDDLDGSDAHWWMVFDSASAEGTVDVCDFDPGFGVDVQLSGSLRALVDVWLGNRAWPEVLRHGDLRVDGPRRLARALPSWFRLSLWVDVPRPESATSVSA
ncbi:MAG: winged helix-turn-helix transcriptional regulator [Nocardioidaceae bacterium]